MSLFLTYNLMKIIFLIFSILLFCLSCNKTENTQNSKKISKDKPNIIVILLDDAGYVDFGFMGSKDLKTPHIDSIASAGVKFTDAHVSATVCAPSRAGLITGQYQQRFGFEANGTGFGESGDIGLADDVFTIADVFQKNDYKTIAIGKWHLGDTASDHPNQRGFDEFYGFTGGSRSYFPLKNPSDKLMLQHNGKQVKFDGYLTDVLGDKSVEYIDEYKDEPFFMFLAYNAVHTPMDAKDSVLKKFKNHPRQTLAAMTWSVDENIGKLTSKLKDLNLFDNTLIFFLSDNGGAHNNDSNHGVLKGWKGNKFEAGHRVPFVVSWPKKIKANQTFDGLTSSLDIFKTSISAANISQPEDLILDGTNLLPYLTGDKNGNPHDELYWRKLDESAARLGDYKIIGLKDFGVNLYDLSNDLSENINLASKDTTKLNLIQNKYAEWESKLMDPLWREGEKWEDITYHIHKRLMQNKPILYKSPSEKRQYLQSIDSINSIQ